MMWAIVGSNKGTPAKARLSKNTRVTAVPHSATCNQDESDADDRQVGARREESQGKLEKKTLPLHEPFLPPLRRQEPGRNTTTQWATT